ACVPEQPRLGVAATSANDEIAVELAREDGKPAISRGASGGERRHDRPRAQREGGSRAAADELASIEPLLPLLTGCSHRDLLRFESLLQIAQERLKPAGSRSQEALSSRAAVLSKLTGSAVTMRA